MSADRMISSSSEAAKLRMYVPSKTTRSGPNAPGAPPAQRARQGHDRHRRPRSPRTDPGDLMISQIERYALVKVVGYKCGAIPVGESAVALDCREKSGKKGRGQRSAMINYVGRGEGSARQLTHGDCVEPPRHRHAILERFGGRRRLNATIARRHCRRPLGLWRG